MPSTAMTYPSLNLEYIFYRVFELLTSAASFPGGAPTALQFAVFTIVVVGMTLSIILLTMVIYVRIRLIQVEHEGFRAREEAERLRYVQQSTVVKNAQWDHIVTLSNSTNESDWRRAILEADIMLDKLLTDKGYIGETLGEKLRSVNPQQFTTINYAWEAHRVRNAVAHLGEAFPLTEREMRATIDNYQRVFEEFDYI